MYSFRAAAVIPPSSAMVFTYSACLRFMAGHSFLMNTASASSFILKTSLVKVKNIIVFSL